MSHKKPAGDACLTCPGFHKPCVRPEPAEGKTRLAVVGETPTYSEVHEGQPFGGNSGRLLGRLLRKHGNLSRNQIHWTNAVLCDVDKDDQKEARKHCQQRLLDELAVAGHPTTLALGTMGLQSAVGGLSTPIMKWRGFVIEPRDPVRGSNSGRHTVIGSVHPGFVQRSEAWMPIFEADVARACRVARSGFTRPEDSARTVIGTSIDLVRETLSRLDTNVVVDIETTGLDIHTVSITCLVIADTKTALVIPISKTLFGDGFYFGHQHQEVIDAINEALEDRVAVTHNGPAFDHIGLARYGIKIQQWDDSLNAYHVITSHFPKSLGHVVACYLDAPPWKQWKHNGSLEQLWAYCGRDGLYNAQAWHSLRASMTEDDMVVYEHDKRNAIMCQRMSQNGFLFDQERAAELSQHMVNEEARLQDQAGEILGRQINLLSPKQLQDAFFRQLRAPITFVSDKGQPSLGEEALLGYAASANDKLRELATLVLRYRSVRMCRAKNITNIKPHEDGRVRPSWYSYGTCLPPGTRVLTTDLRWVPIETCAPGDELIGFGEEQVGVQSLLERSTVLRTGRMMKQCVRIHTDKGVIESSCDHQWVVRPKKFKYADGNKVGGKRQWRQADELEPGDLMCRFSEPWDRNASSEAGYIAGMLDGEGCIPKTTSARGTASYVVFAQKSGPVAERFKQGLDALGIEYNVYYDKRKTESIERVKTVAGDGLRLLGMVPTTRMLEHSYKLWEGACPAIGRGKHKEPAKVLRVEKIGLAEVVALETSTHTFIAEGFLSHNCSGRWASGDPNLSNLPKGNKDPSLQWGGIRSLYIVQAGRKLVGFDIAQAEFRVAAHLTGDPNMLEACKPGRDVHRENAARIFERFGEADKDRQAKLRGMAKTANFAVCYLAGPGTVHARFVANGEKITFAQTEAFLNRLKKAFAVYYEYQDKALFDTMRTGIVKSPIIGRVRWLGYNPDPAKVANFPIQSGAADCMNIKLWKIFQEIDRRGLDAKLVAMVYDAAYFDTAEKDVAAVSELCQSVFDEPITIGGLPCVLPIDLKAKNRWSEL